MAHPHAESRGGDGKVVLDFLCLSSGVLEVLDRHSTGFEGQPSELGRQQSCNSDARSIDPFPDFTSRATVEN